ncbi:MAG: hypothetical protein ACNI25_14225 [Halarcobacter sp.]
MNPLQYTSEEMYSSTDLIRKSKMIFEKLHKKKIEKAIILRDGKPGFMLLDFETYEELMSEYLSLKELLDKKDSSKVSNNNEEKKVSFDNDKNIDNELTQIDELSDEDIEGALKDIEELDLDSFDQEIKDDKPLKEFWE